VSSYLRDLVARTIGAANVLAPRLGPAILAGYGEVADSAAPAFASGPAAGVPAAAQADVRAPSATREAGAPPPPPLPESDPQGSGIASSRKALFPSRDSSFDSPETVDSPEAIDSSHSPRLPRSPLEGDAVSVCLPRRDESGGTRDGSSGTPADDASRPSSKAARREERAAGDASRVFESEDLRRPSRSTGELTDETYGRNRRAASPAGDVSAAARSRPEDASTSPATGAATGSAAPHSPARTYAARREAAKPQGERDGNDTVVNVTIGRIEVRAPAEPGARALPGGARPAASPRSELDAYLRGRSEARR
jgi:hypothetical protein